jgi:aldose 1-epimerase
VTTPLSGTQYSIAHGRYTASIASIGASLRELRFDDRDLVVPFSADEIRPKFRGATLAPWPNRITDGRYELDGVPQQLALTEPERGHALHGLVGWQEFTAISESPSEVVLGAVIEPQSGYPFRVFLSVRFTLGDGGLESEVVASNLSAAPAPFGTGPHPYLVAGPGRVDDWTLELPAATVLTVTEDRLMPIAVVPVAEAGLGFESPRMIGDTFIDHAFSALHRENGVATVRVTSGSTGVVMHWDSRCPWVQVHTADQPSAAENRIGLAVEPMTCPPDAFNSGTDLVWIEPGASTSAGWTIAAL